MKVEDMESVIIIWFSSTGVAHRFISLDYEKKIKKTIRCHTCRFQRIDRRVTEASKGHYAWGIDRDNNRKRRSFY